MLLTTDLSLETLHFRRDWHTAESAGHRCLARGLSDLAAMGAQPLAAFLSLALPPELVIARSSRGRASWRDRFLNGLLTLAGEHHVPLAGGDTAQAPVSPMEGIRTGNTRFANTGLAIADIVLVGSAPKNRALQRSTANAGDLLYVTGYLGGAAAELAALAAHPKRFAKIKTAAASRPAKISPHPHLFPQPRVAVGRFLLARHLATAAIDISDGLSTDLDHLCEESGLHAIIHAAAMPIHPLASAMANPLLTALHGGEDYELLFTASPSTHMPRSIASIPITCIGEMKRSRHHQPRMQLSLSTSARTVLEPLLPQGWEHYRAR